MARLSVVAPLVAIELGDVVRHLKFDLQALALVREELGVDLLKDPMALDALPTDSIGTLIWAALTHEDEALDVDGAARRRAIRSVYRMIHPGNLGQVMSAMFRAFGASMPDAKDDEAAGETDPNVSGPS